MTTLPHEACIDIRGEITLQREHVDSEPAPWVYQRAPVGKGNITRPGQTDLQLRRKGTRTDRLTSKNATHRERFRQANAAWSALTETERDAYRERAVKLPFTGYNLWMREYRITTPAHRRRAASINAIIGLRLLEIFGL